MICIYLVAILVHYNHVNLSVVLFNVYALFKWLYLLGYIYSYVFYTLSQLGRLVKYLYIHFTTIFNVIQAKLSNMRKCWFDVVIYSVLYIQSYPFE